MTSVLAQSQACESQPTVVRLSSIHTAFKAKVCNSVFNRGMTTLEVIHYYGAHGWSHLIVIRRGRKWLIGHEPFKRKTVEGKLVLRRKLVLDDRPEALVYILAHDLRHMHQQHGYAVHSNFPVGRVKNARGRYSEVCTEAYAIHKLRAWRHGVTRRVS
jgi:hypothetical protein